jgi:alkylated DNA repair dioxygenase AlkB
MAIADGLFGPDVPDGFRYAPAFVSVQEERELATAIAGIHFAHFEMYGVVARRRVAFFGASYDAAAPAPPPVPAFLLPLRSRLSAWAAVEPDAFAMALINEYQPGAPIGWHRDAPQYDIVAGVSLLSPCRMRFRLYGNAGFAPGPRPRRVATHELVLEPRSAYLMTGESRQAYEHHIPAVSSLRYSITFRTLRG